MQSKKILNQIIPATAIRDEQIEGQNCAYEGFTFRFEEQFFRSRLAKKTAKKKGYFVSFWEKNEGNENQAFDYDGAADKTLIAISDNEQCGLFIFPKKVLAQQKILRSQTHKGKMAIRVYPSWETDLNAAASNTQRWQQLYFIDLSKAIDSEKVQLLLAGE